MQIPRWPISSPDVMLLKVELSGDACNQLALWQRFRGSTVCNAAPRWLLIPGHVAIWGGTIVLVKIKIFKIPFASLGSQAAITNTCKCRKIKYLALDLRAASFHLLFYCLHIWFRKSWFLQRLVSLTVSKFRSSVSQNITLSKVKRQLTVCKTTFGILKISRLGIERM